MPVNPETLNPAGVQRHRRRRRRRGSSGVTTVNATLGGAGVAATEAAAAQAARTARRRRRRARRASTRTTTELGQTVPTTPAAETAKALALYARSQGQYARTRNLATLMDVGPGPINPDIKLNQLLALRKEQYKAAKRQQRQVERVPVRHKRQRSELNELVNTTIPHLQKKQQRLSQVGPFGTDFGLTAPGSEETAKKQARVERKLAAAHAEANRLSALVRTRRGRRAPPITPAEAALAILGAAPVGRVGEEAALGLRGLVRGGAEAATRVSPKAAAKAAPGLLRRTVAAPARAVARTTESVAARRAAAVEVRAASQAARVAARQEARARGASTVARVGQEAGWYGKGAARGAATAAKGATFPVRHPLQTGKGVLAAQAPLAVGAQAGVTPDTSITNLLQAPTEILQAAVEHPGQFATSTLHGARDALFGIPPSVMALAIGSWEALPGTPGGAERLQKLGESIISDVEARYGPLAEGDKQAFRDQLTQGYEITGPNGETIHVPGGGAAPFVLDALILAPPIGRFAGSAARSGFLGPAAERFATAERATQRISGDLIRVPETSKNLGVIPFQRAADRARAGLTARRAFKGDGAAVIARDAGQISPAFRGTNASRAVAGIKGRAILKGKSHGAEEVGRGLLGEASRLTPAEQSGLHASIQLGIRGPEQARRELAKRIEQIKAYREAHPDLAVPKGWDNIPALEKLIKNADKVFTERLGKLADEQVVRGNRLGNYDPTFQDATPAVRNARPQGKFLGVARFKEASPQEFYPAFTKALKGERGKFLSKYTPEQIKGLEPLDDGAVFEGFFVSDDGKVGVALIRHADGKLEAGSLFNEKGPRGAGIDLLKLAEANGANYLTAFGDELRRKYEGAGFHVTEKMNWNDEYAPAGWNYERDGRPPVYVMERNEGPQPTPDARENFLKRVDEARKREGLSEAGYFPSHIRRNRPDFSVRAFGGSKAVRPVREYQGKLYDLGIEDTRIHVLAEGYLRNIKNNTNWNLVGDLFDKITIPETRNKSLFEQLRWMEEKGIDENSMVFINTERFRKMDPVDELGKEIDQGDFHIDPDTAGSEAITNVLNRTTMNYTEAARLADEVHGHTSDPSRFATTHGWSLAPKKEFEEIASGMKQTLIGRVANIALTQKPSRWILGAGNVPWLKFQVISNGILSGLIGGVGPAEWAKSALWWHRLTPAERQAISPYLGDGSHFFPEESKLGAASTNRLVNAYRAFKESVGGKVLYSSKKEGGPTVQSRDLWIFNAMFAADRAQNNFFRHAVFYNKLKKDALLRMSKNAGIGAHAQNRIMGYFQLDPEGQMRAMLNDGKSIEANAKAAADLLGDYTTFTSVERTYLKRYVMFYSFLRFSTRLAFYTLPAHHPIMTGLLGHMARMTAAETQDLLGSDLLPYALGRYYMDGGNLVADFQRANPVMNALTQTVFGYGAQGKFSGLIGLFSPWFGSAYTQLSGQDPFTGRPLRVEGETTARAALGIPPEDRARIFAHQFLSMFFPYRVIEEIQAQGRPFGADHLVFSPRYTEYKDPEIKQAIRKRSREMEAPLGTQLFRQMFPELPQPSRDMTVSKDLRQQIIDEARQLGSDQALEQASQLLGIPVRQIKEGSSSSSSSGGWYGG